MSLSVYHCHHDSSPTQSSAQSSDCEINELPLYGIALHANKGKRRRRDKPVVSPHFSCHYTQDTKDISWDRVLKSSIIWIKSYSHHYFIVFGVALIFMHRPGTIQQTTNNILLTFHSNYGPVLYQDK